MNNRERVSLALLGLFLLIGMGLVAWQRSRQANRAPKPVTATQADDWNQRLAHARQVDVNTATSAELERLPGIGPALANRIVDDRSRHGPFSTAHDITRVSGIGEKTYESISRRLTVRR